MTSSTKPEVHGILHYCQRWTAPRPQVTCTVSFVKFGRAILRYASEQTDIRTRSSQYLASVPRAKQIGWEPTVECRA